MSAFADYLEQAYTLKPSAHQIQVIGPCPFCGHDSPDQRMYVNPKNDVGFCHHCSQGFSKITFIMAREGCDRDAAWAILRNEQTGYVRSEDEEEDDDKAVPWPELVDVFDYPEAHGYLAGRGVSDAMIHEHQIKYCVANMTFKDKLYWTANRIIVPIYDLEGVAVGWQGRDITGRSRIKYLFPPNFKSANYLFNIHYVDRGAKYLILSEGMFDVFGWKRLGLRNVVDTFGKKISDMQIDAILEVVNPDVIFMAWDSDAHWERDVFCETYGHLFKIKIIDLEGKDADEITGREAIKALINARAYDWNQKILACL